MLFKCTVLRGARAGSCSSAALLSPRSDPEVIIKCCSRAGSAGGHARAECGADPRGGVGSGEDPRRDPGTHRTW